MIIASNAITEITKPAMASQANSEFPRLLDDVRAMFVEVCILIHLLSPQRVEK
jgi:hypothetical protein